MITERLVAEAIERARGDRNAYRIASYVNYLGYAIGAGDMNRIRDILGEAHPIMREDGKLREPKGRRSMSRNHQKEDEGVYGKRAPRRKGGAA